MPSLHSYIAAPFVKLRVDCIVSAGGWYLAVFHSLRQSRALFTLMAVELLASGIYLWTLSATGTGLYIGGVMPRNI